MKNPRTKKVKEARKWILRGWKLTQMMAWEKWRLSRLAPVVRRMRLEGHVIDDLGRKGSFSIYKLIKP